MTDVAVDLASITVAEWERAEQVTGRSATELLDDVDDETSAVLSWLVMLRTDPTVTYDQVAADLAGTVVDEGALPDVTVDVMARVCVALRIGPDEFRRMTPVEVAAVVNVLDEED